jgi:hypothetical protein
VGDCVASSSDIVAKKERWERPGFYVDKIMEIGNSKYRTRTAFLSGDLAVEGSLYFILESTMEKVPCPKILQGE